MKQFCVGTVLWVFGMMQGCVVLPIGFILIKRLTAEIAAIKEGIRFGKITAVKETKESIILAVASSIIILLISLYHWLSYYNIINF